MRECAERHRATTRRLNVNVLQLTWMLLKVWQGLENNVILIGLCKERRDLTLAERVVKCLVDDLRRDAQSRRRDAINDKGSLCSHRLLIGRNVLELRQRLQPVHEAGGPSVQLVLVRIFQTVLVLRSTDAILDSQILNWLHVKSDSINFRQRRLQTSHDLRGTNLPLGERLEIDQNASTVQRCICSVDSDKRGKTLYRTIFENDLGESLLLLGHRGK